jgi:hypothetical protein
MKSQHHFEIRSATALREATKILTFIADLDRIVRILNCDIATDEGRTRVFDRSDAKYSILARAWQRAGTILRTPSLRLNSVL